jgi:hypothetical protein
MGESVISVSTPVTGVIVKAEMLLDPLFTT